jgi:hypothetical protein
VLDTWQRRVAASRRVVVLSVCCGRARSAGEACRRKTADAPGRRKSDSGSAPPPAALSRPLATAGAARCCDDGTSGSTRSGRARQRTSKRHSAARPRRARVHTESARNSRDEKRRDEKRAAVSAERCDSFLWRLSEEEDQSLVRALAERAPRRLGGALLPRCGAHVHRRCHSIAAIGAPWPFRVLPPCFCDSEFSTEIIAESLARLSRVARTFRALPRGAGPRRAGRLARLGGGARQWPQLGAPASTSD